MNFGSTKRKLQGSLAGGIIFGGYVSLDMVLRWPSFASVLTYILPRIIIASILVYILWSLLEPKKVRKRLSTGKARS